VDSLREALKLTQGAYPTFAFERGSSGPDERVDPAHDDEGVSKDMCSKVKKT
jgi:hypothetical protein